MPIINSLISAGKNPTGTKTITTNGVVDVSDYANADVQVPTTAPKYFLPLTVNNSGKLIRDIYYGFSGLGSDVKSVDDYVFYKAFSDSPSSMISGVLDLSSLITVGQYSFNYAFSGCTGITSVNLSSLQSMSSRSFSNAFSGCTGITSVNLSSLQSITSYSLEYTFYGCTSLTSLSFDSLQSITAANSLLGMCMNNTQLISVSFPVLNTFNTFVTASYAPVFGGCTKLESISFPGLKSTSFGTARNMFNYFFNSNTGSQALNGCIIHFPSNFDPTNPDKTFDITTMTGYPTFGGDANYIHLSYDLPATE